MFVGMDVHKESVDISLAEEGRNAEVRHYGKIAGGLGAGEGGHGVAEAWDGFGSCTGLGHADSGFTRT